MAHSIQAPTNVQASVETQAAPPSKPPAPSTGSKYAAPQDTVNISAQAQAASQGQKSSGDADRDGDSK